MSQDSQQSKPSNPIKLAASRLKTSVVNFFISCFNASRDYCNRLNINLRSNNESSKQNSEVVKTSREAVPKEITFLSKIDKDYRVLMSELFIASELFAAKNCIVLETLFAMLSEYFKEDTDWGDNRTTHPRLFENICDLFQLHKDVFESGIYITDTTEFDEKYAYLIAKTIRYLAKYYEMNDQLFDCEQEPLLIREESARINIKRLYSLPREYNQDVYSLIERFRIRHPNIYPEQLYCFREALARLLDDYCPHERSEIDANLQVLANNQKSETIEKEEKKGLKHFFNSCFNASRDYCNRLNITLKLINKSYKQNSQVIKMNKEEVPKEIEFLRHFDEDYQALMLELTIASKLYKIEIHSCLDDLYARFTEYFKGDTDRVDNCMIKFGLFENIYDLLLLHEDVFESGISITDTTEFDEMCFHCIAKTIGYLTRFYEMNEEQFRFEIYPLIIWEDSVGIIIKRLFSLPREYNQDVYILIERFRIRHPNIYLEQLYCFRQALARLMDDYCPHKRSKIDASLRTSAGNQKSEPIEKKKKKGLKHFFSRRK